MTDYTALDAAVAKIRAKNPNIAACFDEVEKLLKAGSPPPPPPPPPPPVGTVTFDGLSMAPGWQAKYTLINSTFAGGLITDHVGFATVQIHTSGGQKGAIQAKQWRAEKIRLGTTEWYGLGFRFPVGWSPGQCLLWEGNYDKLVWGPVFIGATKTSLFLELNTGLIDWHGKTPGPDTTGVTHALNTGIRNLAPLTTGEWHYLLVHVKWETTAIGFVTVYHRTTSAPAWTKVDDLQNVPTVQYGYGISPPDYVSVDGLDQNGQVKTTSDMVGLYDYYSTTQDDVADMLGMVVGTTPGVCAAGLGLAWP